MEDKRLEATARLLEVMNTLRRECPWDREQTFESLRSNTIEETFELADAIADRNMAGIKEELGDLLGGTAIIESIFMWDGVGKLAVDAITMRDYPLIQAYVVWMAIIYMLVNLITDLLYHALDPRIRLGVSEE